MKSLLEEGATCLCGARRQVGVDMPPLPDDIWKGVALLLLTEEPTFSATSSDTLATWSIPGNEPITTTANPCNGIKRWYDPITGRFLSKDPLGIAFGLNQYIFPGNNPVNFRDPLGLCSESRYNDRMNAISGTEALLESQHGPVFNFFAQLLTGILRRGVQTAYEGEQSGLSPSTAYGLGTAQGIGETAFVGATVQLGGIALGQGLGSIPALIPAAGGAGGGSLQYGDNLRKTDLYHNFPYSFDSVVLQNGVPNTVSQTYTVYTQPGSVNGIQGVYEIGVNQAGVITHRMFSAGAGQ